MAELAQWLQQHIEHHSFFYCLVLYATGGKPAALIAAKVVGLDLLWFFPLIMLMDALQIPCFHYLYVHIFRYRSAQRLSRHLQMKFESVGNQHFFTALKRLGPPGILFLSMLPVKGGGIWSAVLLAHLTGLPMKTTFPLLIFGSILSGFMFVGLGDGLIRLWHLIP